MPALLRPLLKQFALLEHPVRYFIYRLLIVFGAIRFISDLYLFFFNKEFMIGINVFVMLFLLTILLFISEYFEQKKLKRISAQTNAT